MARLLYKSLSMNHVEVMHQEVGCRSQQLLLKYIFAYFLPVTCKAPSVTAYNHRKGTTKFGVKKFGLKKAIYYSLPQTLSVRYIKSILQSKVFSRKFFRKSSLLVLHEFSPDSFPHTYNYSPVIQMYISTRLLCNITFTRDVKQLYCTSLLCQDKVLCLYILGSVIYIIVNLVNAGFQKVCEHGNFFIGYLYMCIYVR